MTEKTAQIVKMFFIFAVLKLKAIFKEAVESVPFCNYFDKQSSQNIVFFLISHNFVQAAGFENENL